MGRLKRAFTYLDYRYMDELEKDSHQPGWSILTPRERQVAMLVCQPTMRGSVTNREIASTLSISPETVKIHVRNVLSKFNLHSKAELRQVLAGWDFSDGQALGD